MLEKFNQYYLTKTLNKKYSHSSYLASPVEDSKHQVVLDVFASSLFHFPFSREHENLLQKAQRVRQLQHPRLISILDMGIEEEQPFVVWDYLPNGSLRRRMKKVSPGRLKLGDALTIVLQVGGALAYAHEYNVIHGNIKPENILFNASGQVVLTNFSLVSKKEVIIRDQATEEYAFCYMAPEQFDGVCDARSDQYALACVAYELITGRLPFATQGIQGLKSGMKRQREVLPTPLSESGADLPSSFEASMLKALSRDPAERFFDFSLFLDVIQSVLSPPPAFPLVRSNRSHENSVMIHSIRLAEAKDVSSPISNHRVLPNAVSRSPAVSGAISNVEVSVAKAVKTGSLSQVSMPEWAGIIPFPYDSLTLALQSYQVNTFLAEDANSVGKRDPNELLKVQEPNGSPATRLERVSQVEFPVSEQGMITWMTEEQPEDVLFEKHSNESS